MTLSGERAAGEISRDLKRAGLAIDQVLEPIGVVTGKASPRAAAKLRKIQGVADVSGDHPVSIAPPRTRTSNSKRSRPRRGG